MDLLNSTIPSQSLSYSELFQIAKQDPIRSLPEQLWWSHYAFWDNDILATGIIAFLAHELIYFGRCLPWIIADALPNTFHRYKIQDTKPAPSAIDQWTCTKYILLIHFVIELPLIVLFHPMMDLCGLQYTIPFPRFSLLAAQITLFFLVEDTYHYWLHRLMHWGPLYRAIHRVHHQYAAPFGLTAEYASPWETFLLGLGTIGPPLVLGKITGNVHLVTVLVWMTLRQLQAIDAHSGYDFPWSLRRLVPFWGGADWHDDHHRYFWGNYSSSFKHWDILMGTVSGPRGCPMAYEHTMDGHPLRLVIYVCVTDITGNPQRRHLTLGEAVCSTLLHRKFHAQPQPTGYDHVHIPADFDSALPLKRWFIFDLNVHESLASGDVTRIPHLVYLASRQGNEW